MQDSVSQTLSDLIREATWCQCTQFTAEAEDAVRRAGALEAERDRYREALEAAAAKFEELQLPVYAAACRRVLNGDAE